ncbi:hypothetical protein [Polaromonas eurypsychrophila]|uniref:Uncharacterized protein n=1 Tax=Polaromonas eurypsychrophila TaxID=1614635 RepID=A0A916SRN1_9BURK|nr:hypothetical protein [Polaromonas eurypsychrophila]GGB12857.1 hypothetical protein GCM10011496_37200 [Polaromonas eurypsychrophila]
MSDHTSALRRSPAASGPLARSGMLKAFALGLASVAVMLVLRSIPLAGQLWDRPELARVSQAPMLAATEKSHADLAFRCC